MPLKPISFADARRKLQSAGFEVVSQSGSHVKFAKQTSEGIRTAIVPFKREVPVGTLRSALRQAGISDDEWNKL